MRTFVDRLDAMREKPHHVRRQVAFVAAGLITGAVGLGWLGASLYTGAFALRGSSFAEVTGAAGQEAAQDGARPPGASSAAAAAALPPPQEGPATLETIRERSEAAAGAPTQTIIPF